MDRRPVIGFETDAETGVLLKNDRKTDGSKQIQNSESLRRYIRPRRFVSAHAVAPDSANSGERLHAQNQRVRLILSLFRRFGVNANIRSRALIPCAPRTIPFAGIIHDIYVCQTAVPLREARVFVRYGSPVPLCAPPFRSRLVFRAPHSGMISVSLSATAGISATEPTGFVKPNLSGGGAETAYAENKQHQQEDRFKPPASALKRYDTLLYTPAALRSSVKPCPKAIFSHFLTARSERCMRSVAIRRDPVQCFPAF